MLETLTRSGKTAAPKFVHARALLLCDAGPHGSPWKVADVAEALGVTSRTVEHLKERFVEEGIEAQKRKQKEFYALAERYRAATDPQDVARLGDDLGRMVFGD